MESEEEREVSFIRSGLRTGRICCYVVIYRPNLFLKSLALIQTVQRGKVNSNLPET